MRARITSTKDLTKADRKLIIGRHRGIVSDVATQLGKSYNYVSDVFHGRKPSKPVSDALIAEIAKREAAYTQPALDRKALRENGRGD